MLIVFEMLFKFISCIGIFISVYNSLRSIIIDTFFIRIFFPEKNYIKINMQKRKSKINLY